MRRKGEIPEAEMQPLQPGQPKNREFYLARLGKLQGLLVERRIGEAGDGFIYEPLPEGEETNPNFPDYYKYMSRPETADAIQIYLLPFFMDNSPLSLQQRRELANLQEKIFDVYRQSKAGSWTRRTEEDMRNIQGLLKVLVVTLERYLGVEREVDKVKPADRGGKKSEKAQAAAV